MYPYKPRETTANQASGLESAFGLAQDVVCAIALGRWAAIDRMRMTLLKARERLLVGSAHDVGLLAPGLVSRPPQVGPSPESSVYLSEADADRLLLEDFERQTALAQTTLSGGHQQ